MNIKENLNKLEIEYKSNKTNIDKKISSLKDNKQKLYEDWKFGKIDKEEYLKETDSIKIEIDNLNNQYKINEENYTEILKNKSKDDSWIEHYKRNRKIKKVSKKVLKELVDSILVNEDKSIKVIFKYRDSYNECLNLLKGEVLNNE